MGRRGKTGSNEHQESGACYPGFLLALFRSKKRRPFLPSVWNENFIVILFFDFI